MVMKLPSALMSTAETACGASARPCATISGTAVGRYRRLTAPIIRRGHCKRCQNKRESE
jgi:hypothetical protein